MDSSRLRIPNQSVKKLDTSVQFAEGDKVLARWTDSRKFPGIVTQVLEDSESSQICCYNLVDFQLILTNFPFPSHI